MEVKARTLGICLEYLRVLFARGNVRTNYMLERNIDRVKEAIDPLRKMLQDSIENEVLKRKTEELIEAEKEDDEESLSVARDEYLTAKAAADAKNDEVNEMMVKFEPYRIKLEHLPLTFGPKTIGSMKLDDGSLDYENKVYNNVIFGILGPASLDTVFEFLRKDLDLIEE